MVSALAFACTIPLAAPQDSTPAPLRVGTTTRLPYSWKDADGQWTGPAIYLWEKVASKTGYTFEYLALADQGLQSGLRDGSIDLAATGMQLTAEAAAEVDFSVPFEAGGYSAIVHDHGVSKPLMMLKSIFVWEILIWVVAIGAATIIAGLAIRWVESRKNPDHFGHRASRINGFWWAITTLSTVGYGDLVPKSSAGKFLAAAWMLASLVLVTMFTSSVVAALTIGRLEPKLRSIREIDHGRIAIVDREASKSTAARLGVLPRVFPDPAAALHALSENEVEAFLHPTHEAVAILARERDSSFSILPREVVRGFVAFGLNEKLHRDQVERINCTILEVIEGPEWLAAARMIDHPDLEMEQPAKGDQ